MNNERCLYVPVLADALFDSEKQPLLYLWCCLAFECMNEISRSKKDCLKEETLERMQDLWQKFQSTGKSQGGGNEHAWLKRQEWVQETAWRIWAMALPAYCHLCFPTQSQDAFSISDSYLYNVQFLCYFSSKYFNISLKPNIIDCRFHTIWFGKDGSTFYTFPILLRCR